ncbi:hypothetical protein NDU88_003373 [Pleurodeles waltl]|uniref:Uncharacterized protein n=1 Tax=Pleurodeles waltl TaxID=8319 RepID=A0AAV7T694_PLEWA|nr:hypothetical protein NDU88_003373 [Pleurodeles waltl]
MHQGCVASYSASPVEGRLFVATSSPSSSLQIYVGVAGNPFRTAVLARPLCPFFPLRPDVTLGILSSAEDAGIYSHRG